MKTREVKTPIYFRDTTRAASVNEETREIAFSFSSEEPVERWIDGERALEVLSHKPRHVRLGRLRDGGPLLLNHWADDHIGVHRSVAIEDGRGVATAYISQAGKGPDALTQVAEGVLTKTSTGYRVYRFKREAPTEEGGLPIYRGVDWEPMENSLVSMPADTTVGVGRESMTEYARALNVPEEITTVIEDRAMPDETKPATPATPAAAPAPTPPPTFNIDAEREAIRQDELKRQRLIREIGTAHNANELAEKACSDGKSLTEFREALLEELAKRPESGYEAPKRMSGIGMSVRDQEQYSLCRAILACADRNWDRAGFERELSSEVASQLGRDPQGFFIPPDVRGWTPMSPGQRTQRDLTVGTDAEAGYLVGTDHRADLYVDALRERTIVRQLGAQFLTDLVGDVAIPAANASTTVYWVGENAAPTEGAPTKRQITMSPKTVAAYVDLSRRTLLQTSPSIEALVRNDMVTGVSIAVDKVGLAGGGTNEPSGVLDTAGIGSVALGTNGAAPTWVSVVNNMKEVDIDNALMGSLAWATTPHARAKMMTTPRQASGVEGNFIIPAERPSELIGYRMEVSNAVPSDLTKGTGTSLSALIFGNWADLIIGAWSGVDVLVDPYSLSTTGALRVTIFQDVDVAVRHAESFSATQDMVTT